MPEMNRTELLEVLLTKGILAKRDTDKETLFMTAFNVEEFPKQQLCKVLMYRKRIAAFIKEHEHELVNTCKESCLTCHPLKLIPCMVENAELLLK